MARLFAVPPHEVAAFADATIRIEPTVPGGSPAVVEMWERIVPFGVQPGNYARVGSFDQSDSQQRTVDPGAVYQARLFRDDNGNPSGSGEILGKVDMPSIEPELRTDFLTACTEGRPQLRITTGGTFASFVVATSAHTCVRVQLATTKPAVDGNGLPFFPPARVVGSGLSLTPDFVHDVVVTDELRESDIHGHSPLQPDQVLFFILLAWNQTGWDYVWGTQASAPGPAAQPNFESVQTKARRVSTTLSLLSCIDDSDELSDGEAVFTFSVESAAIGFREAHDITWDPMPSGAIRPLNDTIVVDGAGDDVRIQVRAEEDDSPASNDIATTESFRVPFPIGRGVENVMSTVVNLRSTPITTDNDLLLFADIVYSIEYH